MRGAFWVPEPVTPAVAPLPEAPGVLVTPAGPGLPPLWESAAEGPADVVLPDDGPEAAVPPATSGAGASFFFWQAVMPATQSRATQKTRLTERLFDMVGAGVRAGIRVAFRL